MKVKEDDGQSLVELAILLPAFCFSVMVIVQLMVLCRNELEMQRMAQASADRVGATTPDGSAFDSLFNRLWGSSTPPHVKRTSKEITSWKHYRGISTVEDSAQLVSIDVQDYLLPNALITILGPAKQHATSLALREPPVPAGQ